MKFLYFSFLLLAFCPSIWCQPVEATSQSYAQKADEILKKAIDQKNFAGIVAGFSVDGQIKWMSSAGFSDLESEKRFSDHTLIRPASIAKPMTAVAIMQLYEKGLIDLDLPIQQYLPEFPKKPEGEITIRHLLTHTSGIKEYQSSKEAKNFIHYPTLADATKVFMDRTLTGEPGKVYQYTTYGYVVLGWIIEKVSGMSYEDYMKKNIWEKSGMEHTGAEQFGESYPDKASLYDKNKKGKIKKVMPNDLSNRVPGGGLHSCVEDMLLFGQAVLNHTLINESSLNKMLENPGIRQEGNPYGFGWFLYGENPDYGPVFGHSGGQTGASAQLFILPKIKTVIIVMSNTSGAWTDAFKVGVQLFKPAATSH